MLTICEHHCVVKPNASASYESVLKLLTGLFILSSAITLAFVRIGAWLVLPFAGLELLLVVMAFFVVMRHAGDYEKIMITDDDVVIERSVLGKLHRDHFQRYWTRVTLRDNGVGKTSLWIGSHNKQVEFGRATMDNVQRHELASHLKQMLKTKV